MGMVYQAIDPVIGRVVAIKEIRLDELRDERERKEMEERFKLEFRAAGTLSHPNIVTVYDVGEEGGSTFIAMEYVDGQSMAEWLRDTPGAGLEIVLDMAAQIASGLDFAHQHGIVHRDVKPANILLTRDLRPKLSDFGLVKVMSTELTTTGTVLGTPAFMSPEQVTGQVVDPKSDQFSFAVILYGLLTGQQPFRAEHPSSILYKIVHETPELPRRLNPGLPQPVDHVLMRALAKNPNDRYLRCADLVDDLRRAIFGTTSMAGTLNLRATGGNDNSGGMSAALTMGSRPGGPPAIDHFDAGPTVLTQRTLVERRSRKALYGGIVAGIVLTAGFVGYALSSRQTATSVPPALPPAAKPAAPAPPAQAPPQAAAPAPVPVELAIASQPAGAEILVDGKSSGQNTPARLRFEPGTKVALGLRLDGYEPMRYGFAVADLTTRQKEEGLSFTLKREVVPGTVTFEGADYPFEVEVGGRRQKVSSGELALAPGRHEVVVVADAVFLRQTYPVDIASGERQSLRLPTAVPVVITATPANCRVSIGGRFVDATPINDRRLVVGKHQFEFTWPALNRTKTLAVVVSRADQRIFASPD
jgi:tRNA A-37 threonylcarbamoyl transferase component Bud32